MPKKKADNTNFEMTLVGEGWNHRWVTTGYSSISYIICIARLDSEKAATKPNRRVTTVVKGKNIGKLRTLHSATLTIVLPRLWLHL